jgi:hypothetical protein
LRHATAIYCLVKIIVPLGKLGTGRGIPPSHKYPEGLGVNVPVSVLVADWVPTHVSVPLHTSVSVPAFAVMTFRNERVTFAPEVLPVTVPANTLVIPPKSMLSGASVPATVVPFWLNVIHGDPPLSHVPPTLAVVGAGAGVGAGVGVGVGVDVGVGAGAGADAWVEAIGVGAVGDEPPPQLAAARLTSKAIPNRANGVMPSSTDLDGFFHRRG